jgi:hypothetical protein
MNYINGLIFLRLAVPPPAGRSFLLQSIAQQILGFQGLGRAPA